MYQATATSATTQIINTPFLIKLTNQLYDKYIFLLIQFNYWFNNEKLIIELAI